MALDILNPYKGKSDNRRHGQGDACTKQRMGRSGNEATYLAIPTTAAFVLVLVSTLSTPVIKGMSLADIKPRGADGGGVVGFGSWGWCVSGVKDVDDGCSGRRAFGGSIPEILQDLPDGLLVLGSLDDMLPKAYTAASDVFSLIACLVAFWTLGICLVASGAMQPRTPGQYEKGDKWARMAYWFTILSSVLTSIEFGLDVKKYIFIVNASVGVQAARPIVAIGPVIWLKMVALIMNLGCCLVRLISGTCRSESTSTKAVESHSLSIRQGLTPPSNEALPTWETLNLKHTEKVNLARDSVRVCEVESPDFTAAPRFPEGPGGAI